MSLKAKLEAVIYAAEEPVTLTQLAALFGGDALEWKAAQQAAAAEQTAEVVGENPAAPSLPGMDDALTMTPEAVAEAAAAPSPEGNESELEIQPETAPASSGDAEQAESGPEPAAEAAGRSEEEQRPEGAAEPEGALLEPEAEPLPVDTDAEARRLARQRDREIKAILKQILDELIAEYAADARGVEIREIAGGYRMATKPECHDAVRLFVKSLKPALKLSLPALETLAVVAYKQPVTAPEVSEIRGVESGGVLGSLLARKLVATAGRKQVIGRPILYKTTKEFLLRFGLKDLNELPSMEEFEKMAAAEIEEIEPEAGESSAALVLELSDNSPSGQEMAEAAEAMTGDHAEAEGNEGRAAQPTEETAGGNGSEAAGDEAENRTETSAAAESAETSAAVSKTSYEAAAESGSTGEAVHPEPERTEAIAHAEEGVEANQEER